MLISELEVKQKNIDEKWKEMKFKINSWKSNANGLQQTDSPPQMGHL